VPLEVMVNSSRSTRNGTFGGRVRSDRQIVNDVRGRVSELLAKAIDRGALDQELRGATRKRCASSSPSTASSASRAPTSRRAGRAMSRIPAPTTRPGRPMPPLTLAELMATPAAGLPLVFEEFFDQQTPMLQPVGGMDRIAHALYEQVRADVRLESPVTAIRRRGNGVRIHHGPGDRVFDADFCICTLGLNLLQRIPSDFSPAKQAAIRDVLYLASVKVGFESPRFWEEEGIYGGIGWTDQPNENLLYPSGHWHADKGILVAAYCANWTGNHLEAFAAMPHEQRFQICRDVVERHAPGQGRLLDRPVTVGWGLTPWSEGVGPINAEWGGGPRTARYAEMLRPKGRSSSPASISATCPTGRKAPPSRRTKR
jgi:monoamine oxidase